MDASPSEKNFCSSPYCGLVWQAMQEPTGNWMLDRVHEKNMQEVGSTAGKKRNLAGFNGKVG